MAADPLTTRTAEELLRDHVAFDTDDEDLAQRPPLNTERDDKAVLSPRKRKAENDLRDDIIEEEVKISKQRKKIPKLDTDKLLSEPGIPKMRSSLRSGQLKKKLRLKGKGHEFSDTARLLNYYQMWLDNLYPRAKFADAVQMVEKAGHTKKMQMYRKSWIDEGKPGHIRREEVELALTNQDEVATNVEARKNNSADNEQLLDEDPASMFFGGNDDDSDVGDQNGPDDDELDALLAQASDRPTMPSKKHTEVDSEDEDDLDAILAQSVMHRKTASSKSDGQNDGLDKQRNKNVGADEQSRQDHAQNSSKTSTTEDVGDDDLDVLLAEGQPQGASEAHAQPHDDFDDEDFLDEDMNDLDALLHNQSTATELELPRHPMAMSKPGTLPDGMPGSEEVPELDNIMSSSPIPNVHTDELDQLMDEHDAAIEQQKKKVDPEILEEFMSSSPLESAAK